MVDLLADNPVLTLFVVAAFGVLVGRIRMFGFALGVAAVLFVGLGAGAIDADLALPEEIHTLGLVLFVYTIGVASGPSINTVFSRRGLSANLLVLAALVVGLGAVLVAAAVIDVGEARAAGLFAGALTNTPALAGVVDTLRHGDGSTSAPVVAYSLAYPLGVVGMLVAVHVALRQWRRHPESGVVDDELPVIISRTYRITRDDVGPLGDAAESLHADVIFSRVKHDGVVTVAGRATSPVAGDLVNLLGAEDDVDRLGTWLGDRSDEHLPLDRRDLDFRRIFVSRPSVAGRTLASLDLAGRFGAVATRVRRGDVDLLATDDLVLELGDRVRVVGPRQRMGDVAAHFGDSFRALGEIDVITFSLGIALGMLLGAIPVPLPGGEDFRLGFAGGPLLVGLLLGAIGRTGPLVWQLPHNANQTLRQLGTVLFLAGIGTRSGDAFASTVGEPEGLRLVLAGLAVTIVVATAFLVAARRFLDAGPAVLVGALAGLQTQPAVLTFAASEAGEHQASLGYATVYPLAMIAKIVLAQVVLLAL